MTIASVLAAIGATAACGISIAGVAFADGLPSVMERDEPSARRSLCSRFGVTVGVMLAVTFGVMVGVTLAVTFGVTFGTTLGIALGVMVAVAALVAVWVAVALSVCATTGMDAGG